MNIRTILHNPSRAAAVAAVPGVLFAACGSASGSETAQPDTTQPGRDVPVTNAADGGAIVAGNVTR